MKCTGLDRNIHDVSWQFILSPSRSGAWLAASVVCDLGLEPELIQTSIVTVGAYDQNSVILIGGSVIMTVVGIGSASITATGGSLVGGKATVTMICKSTGAGGCVIGGQAG